MKQWLCSFIVACAAQAWAVDTPTPTETPEPTAIPSTWCCESDGFCDNGGLCIGGTVVPDAACSNPGEAGACETFTPTPTITATPTVTPTPTDTPTRTNTPTRTPTRTGTPVPTPTTGDACMIFTSSGPDDSGFVQSSGATYPPVDAITTATGYPYISRSVTAGVYDIAVGLIRWDISAYVGTPQLGFVSFIPDELHKTDHLTVTCGCYDWSPDVEGGDYTPDEETNTFAQFTMDSLGHEVIHGVALSSFACLNNVAGFVYVRCAMGELAADAPPTGPNVLGTVEAPWYLTLCAGTPTPGTPTPTITPTPTRTATTTPTRTPTVTPTALPPGACCYCPGPHACFNDPPTCNPALCTVTLDAVCGQSGCVTVTPTITPGGDPTSTPTASPTGTQTPTPTAQPVGPTDCCDCGGFGLCTGTCPWTCTLTHNAECIP